MVPNDPKTPDQLRIRTNLSHIDITDLSVGKFGSVPAASRIFIRTYQHIDGWEDLHKQTNAIIPSAF